MGVCGLRAGLGEVGGVASGRTPDHRHGWPPHAAATPRKPQALVSVSVVVKPPTVSFSDHEGQKQKNKKNHKTKNKTKKDVKIQATTTKQQQKKYQPNQEASNQVQVHVWRTPAPRELVPQGAPESGFAWLAMQRGRGLALGKTWRGNVASGCGAGGGGGGLRYLSSLPSPPCSPDRGFLGWTRPLRRSGQLTCLLSPQGAGAVRGQRLITHPRSPAWPH